MRASSPVEAPRQHNTNSAKDSGTEHAMRGGVRFVASRERAALQAPIEAASLLCVDVELPLSGGRGRLRQSVHRAIENALDGHNAPRCNTESAATGPDAILSDQLRRARHGGMRGLCLYVPLLSRIASPPGVLEVDDSATLRWWLQAACEGPILVLLDECDRALGAYGPPARIERWVETATQTLDATSEDASGLGAPASPGTHEGAQLRSASEAEAYVDLELDGRGAEHGPPLGGDAPCTAGNCAGATQPVANSRAPSPPLGPRTEPTDLRASKEPRGCDSVRAGESMHGGDLPRASGDRTSLAPGHLVGDRAWKTWAEELDAARGPKPLGTIERLFVSDYVPLAQAVVRGEGDAGARATLTTWATSFAKSYVEAFGALRITGKRPLMVLDVPQLASRVARLHGAKLTQLVLIDGMRFDLGLRVHERLRVELNAVGRCTERFLLWAALPTTTSAQLELLARGPEALVHRDVSNDREEAFGGRGASILRRVRVGARDLLKLDLVEARLRESGAPEPERLDALACDVASVVSTHAKSLAPRTLLFLFGDHGFQLDRTSTGTGIGRCGGASPEEVLVPAFTWLMGDVH